MTITRNLFSIFLAFFLALGGYWFLHKAITIGDLSKQDLREFRHIDFIRMKDREIVQEIRVKRKPPKIKPKEKIKKIKKPLKSITTKVDNLDIDLDIPKIPLNLNLKTDSDFLSAGFHGRAIHVEKKVEIDSDVMPIFRVPPIYPRRAKILRKEGHVKLLIVISKQGLVKDAKITESKPKGIFDEAALNSVRHWKFRPKKIDGKAIEQVASQTITFTLR